MANELIEEHVTNDADEICARGGMMLGDDSNGRGGGIRTPDPLLPKQMRYQTALRPDIC